MNYWKECLIEAFEEYGISATDGQLADVAGCVEGAFENYGLAHGYECIANPLEDKNRKLTADLKAERDKVQCHECKGRGSVTTYGPSHSATSECCKCHGEGRHSL